ncbi:MAG: thioredoxin domain-containing protein [Gammaproteobacteria bacterium]|nr:MAG: thioredoxin domain-containing protein [Gammaproteobacteria bacterium]
MVIPHHSKSVGTTMKIPPGFAHAAFWLILLTAPAHSAELANELNNHPSPYLALHGNDPVAWQDWGPDVLERARKENKLVFLSIGYFSCHWCHVMQRESYKNPEIAAVLNRYFIPVKIDRELEPALDGKMMDFVQSLRDSGGWPLNAFVTPDGYPVYATLYERPQRFLALLQRLSDLWQKDKQKITTLAHTNLPAGKGPGSPQLDFKRVYRLHTRLGEYARSVADEIHGGFGTSNKFPMEPELAELLTIYQRFDHEALLGDAITKALDAMMNKALRDHLNGGFFRYTTDPDWSTPHFEKMLYNNAQLALLYLRAGKLFDRDDYTRVAHETYRFMIDNMRRPDGAFIGAFSAVDENGKEGGGYLWQKDELKKRLTPEQYRLIELIWGLEDPSQFESGAYLPVPVKNMEEAAKNLGMDPKQAQALYSEAAEKLRQIGKSKQHPADTKKLAGWNGLALASFAEAARRTGNKEYQAVARGIRNYLVEQLWRNGELMRALNKGKPLGQASLQDYGFVAWGLMQWAMLTDDTSDFELARKIANRGYEKFYTASGWRMDDGGLIHYGQTRDAIEDGAMPSPSALLLLAMTRIGNHLDDDKLLEKAGAALNSGWKTLESNPFYFATRLEAAYVNAGSSAR